jgi:uncharacterized protein YjbJ (UPF0337 family)
MRWTKDRIANKKDEEIRVEKIKYGGSKMSGLKKEVGGIAKEAAGKLEKAVGKATGKRDVEVKGKLREEAGKAEKELGNIQRRYKTP